MLRLSLRWGGNYVSMPEVSEFFPSVSVRKGDDWVGSGVW